MDPLKALDSYLTKNAFTMPTFGTTKPVATTQYATPTASAPTPAPVVVSNPQPKPVDTTASNKPVDFNNDANFNNLVNFLKTQNTPVTSSVLGSTVTPTVPTPVNNIKAGDTLGSVGSTAVEGATTNSQTIRDLLMKDYTALGLQGEKTLSLQEENKIAQKTQAVNDINSQILQTSRAYEKQIRARNENANGSFGGAMASDVQNIAKQRDEHLADLSIVKAVALGDLDTANSIVDSKIKAEFEPINNQIATLEKMYSMYQNDMTDSEKFAAQNKIDEEKTNAANLSAAKKDAYSTAISAGASPTVLANIGAATTADEAYSAIGNLPGKVAKRDTSWQDINGQRVLVDNQTGAIISNSNAANGGNGNELKLADAQNNIDNISGLLKNSYLSTAVGPNPLSRISLTNFWTGGKGTFIAGVEQLQSQLSLDSLIKAKAQGATFGALSDTEMAILSKSASKLGSWAIKDANGKVIGYQASEGDFKKELDKINNFSKLDYLLKGGKPEDVNAKTMEDGTVWTMNSDGTYTQLR